LVVTEAKTATANGAAANMTVIYKTSIFPTKDNLTVESCLVSACEDA
jgi:hypothetical protein